MSSSQPVNEYMTSLHARGVHLWVEADQLRFRATKGALSAADFAQLQLLKREIVGELRRLDADPAVSTPLSFQQRCFLDLFKSDPSGQSTLTHYFQLTGRLDIERLEVAIAQLLRTHVILRGRLSIEGGDMQMKIWDVGPYRLQRLPCAAFPVDSTLGPMLECQLVDISRGRCVLVLQVHRLAADCYSMNNLIRELWSTYHRGLPAASSGASQQCDSYPSYARDQLNNDADWQRKHADYWKQRLAGATRLEWPEERLRLHDQGSTATSASLTFGPTLSKALGELSRTARTIPAMIMLGIYVATVAKICSMFDFVLPFELVGRNSKQETAIGPYAYPLLLRIQLEGGETFDELLRKVSAEFYRAMVHQDFGRVALAHRGLLRGTFFQWLSWNPGNLGSGLVPEGEEHVEIDVEEIDTDARNNLPTLPSGMSAVEMNIVTTEDDILATAIYRPDVFEMSSIRAMLEHMRELAACVVIDTSRRAIR
jgi:hypothetical protein